MGIYIKNIHPNGHLKGDKVQVLGSFLFPDESAAAHHHDPSGAGQGKAGSEKHRG